MISAPDPIERPAENSKHSSRSHSEAKRVWRSTGIRSIRDLPVKLVGFIRPVVIEYAIGLQKHRGRLRWMHDLLCHPMECRTAETDHGTGDQDQKQQRPQTELPTSCLIRVQWLPSV